MCVCGLKDRRCGEPSTGRYAVVDEAYQLHCNPAQRPTWQWHRGSGCHYDHNWRRGIYRGWPPSFYICWLSSRNGNKNCLKIFNIYYQLYIYPSLVSYFRFILERFRPPVLWELEISNIKIRLPIWTVPVIIVIFNVTFICTCIFKYFPISDWKYSGNRGF